MCLWCRCNAINRCRDIFRHAYFPSSRFGSWTFGCRATKLEIVIQKKFFFSCCFIHAVLRNNLVNFSWKWKCVHCSMQWWTLNEAIQQNKYFYCKQTTCMLNILKLLFTFQKCLSLMSVFGISWAQGSETVKVSNRSDCDGKSVRLFSPPSSRLIHVWRL